MKSEHEKLIQNYINIFSKKENRPDWAVRKKINSNEIVSPSIPFIGKNYNETKLLLYASAENLTYYTEQDEAMEHLDNNSIAINRHRYCFENCSESRFFPHLHIEPVNNGALMVIVAYIMNKLTDLKTFKSPYELAENISVANFGKFSINTVGKNNDYANDLDKLEYSFEYIQSDLEYLKPDILILPKTIWEHKKVKNMIKSILPNIKVIPIMQITTTTINTNIHTKWKEKDKSNLPEWLLNWHESLPENGAIKGKIKENFYSIYTYLDKIIN